MFTIPRSVKVLVKNINGNRAGRTVTQNKLRPFKKEGMNFSGYIINMTIKNNIISDVIIESKFFLKKVPFISRLFL